MADYQTCFCPECRGCLRSRRTVFRHRNLYGLDRYTENIKCSGQPSKKAKFSNLRTSEIPGKSFLLLIALCRFKYICRRVNLQLGKLSGKNRFGTGLEEFGIQNRGFAIKEYGPFGKISQKKLI